MKQNIKKGRYLFYEGEVYDLGGGGDSGEAMEKAEEALAAAQAAQTTADGAATAAGNAQTAADNAQDTADAALAKGLPAGGSSGQVLAKASATDYDAEWVAPPGWDLLWTNASPGSAFAAQTIALDLSSYTLILIIARRTTDAEYISAVGNIGAKAYMNYTATSGSTIYSRTRKFGISASGIAVEAGYTGSGVNNSYCIPVWIYGIK